MGKQHFRKMRPVPELEYVTDATTNKYYGGFTPTVARLIRRHLVPPSVNVCCGTSELGDIRIDYNEKSSATLRAQVPPIPLPDASARTVISDPPYDAVNYEIYKRIAQQRGREDAAGMSAYTMWLGALLREMSRILMPGGTCIVLHWWIPAPPALSLRKIYLINYGGFRKVRCLSVFTKTQHSLESYKDRTPEHFLTPEKGNVTIF